MGINLIAFRGGGGIAVGGVRVSMATPWAVRAELPKAPDLCTDRSILRNGSSSSRRRDLVFVVNPSGVNGRTRPLTKGPRLSRDALESQKEGEGEEE